MERAGDKKKKKSLGRRKVEIKKIENKNNLLVTFSKRRKGLIKKAGELSILSGADIAVLVQSPAGRIHAFGNVPVESIMDRYLHSNSHPNYHHNTNNDNDENEKKCLEILKKLEAEKKAEKSLEEISTSSSRGGLLQWWDQPFEYLNLIDLEEYMNAMEALKNNVIKRADEKDAANININNIDVFIPNLAVDCFAADPPVPHVAADFMFSSNNSTTPLMLFNPTPST